MPVSHRFHRLAFALFTFYLYVSTFTAAAQDSLQHQKTKKIKLVPLPVIYLAPETSLGLGALAMYYFRTGTDSTTRPSNVQNIFIYTLEHQIIVTNPYNIFLKGDDYWLRGEFDYYLFPYQYYGVGSAIHLDHYESYTANYLRLDASMLRKHADDFYAGPSLFYDHYFNISTPEGGMLETGNVLGIQAKSLFGFGLFANYDKRNNIFSPFSGYYLETRLLKYEDGFLGNYNFTDIYLDARKYYQPAPKWETAFQFYQRSIINHPPFYNYALLGGSNRMRGYYQGAYRDQNMTIVQAEVRRYLTRKIIMSAFGGLGSVSRDFAAYDKILGSYGAGLRYELDNKEHVRIRLDYAFGNHTNGIYIDINEAF